MGGKDGAPPLLTTAAAAAETIDTELCCQGGARCEPENPLTTQTLYSFPFLSQWVFTLDDAQ